MVIFIITAKIQKKMSGAQGDQAGRDGRIGPTGEFGELIRALFQQMEQESLPYEQRIRQIVDGLVAERNGLRIQVQHLQALNAILLRRIGQIQQAQPSRQRYHDYDRENSGSDGEI